MQICYFLMQICLVFFCPMSDDHCSYMTTVDPMEYILDMMEIKHEFSH